jgi:predicted ester cyclase
MTTADNKMVIRRFYEEVMGQGRVEILDEVMDENFVDHGEAFFGSPKGRETLRQGIAATHGILAGLTVTLEEMIAEGDMVGVRGVMRCTHQGKFVGVAPTGNELTWTGNAIFRLSAGKIAERWFNSDSISIVRQLGVGPARELGGSSYQV